MKLRQYFSKMLETRSADLNEGTADKTKAQEAAYRI